MKRLLALAPVLWGTAAAARACPGCATGVSGAGRTEEVLAGFSWSVLFLLGALALAAGGAVLLVVRACRRIEAERAGVSPS